ncbi:MAG: hypothetical protein AM326_09905 [Candidatus Thorarchaeota archaeon SMTZ-45]|nr:MAG: hypothetical protein AM326_09905 [Candidatus Thorarchaeota archaeon SMTZ-45]
MSRKRRQFKKMTPNKVLRVIKPFNQFMQYEASGGILLLVCVIIALLISNSPIGLSYLSFWETYIGISFGTFILTKPLVFWINDLLMAFFFFLIGLEIKREVLIGELSNPRVAMAPIIAAIGGMVVPASLFIIVNPLGSQGAGAWAIPIATDIAIALGLLSIFGSKVPTMLKIFLTTLAIADDIGGVLVIALFYTSELYLLPLFLGLALLSIMVILNRIGIRQLLVYVVLGVVVWLQFLLSGVHPTVAGILIALTIPATTKIDYSEFVVISSDLVKRIQDSCAEGIENIDSKNFQETSETLRLACRDVEAPLQLAEHGLTKWVAFGVIPIFALANSGLALFELSVNEMFNPIAIGIILGLVIGKPLGIISFMVVSVKLGIICLPEGVNWETMIGTTFLAGIGFTISTFIASLALSGSLLMGAKGAILLASFISGLFGVLVLRKALRDLEILSMPYPPVDLGPPNIIKSEVISES